MPIRVPSIGPGRARRRYDRFQGRARALRPGIRLTTLVGGATCCGLAVGCARSVAVYECRRVEGSIAIDGRLDEPAWRAAPRLDIAHPVTAATTAPPPTRAAMLWDDVHLYVGVDVEDPHLVTPFEGRDVRVWRGDCIELFIDAQGGGRLYYEIDVAPNGAWYDANVLRQDGPRSYIPDPSWNPPGLVLRTRRRPRGWTLELKVPHRELPTARHIPPQHGDAWRVNLYRCEVAADAAATCVAWSATSTLHDPAAFGRVVFHHPQRQADLQRRREAAARFLASADAAGADTLAGRFAALRVSDHAGTRFVLNEARDQWRAADGRRPVSWLRLAAPSGRLATKNERAHMDVRWDLSRPARVVVVGRLSRFAAEWVDRGSADGIVVGLSAADGVHHDEMLLNAAEWHLAAIDVDRPDEVTLSISPGPAGNTMLDSAALAVYMLPRP